MAILIIALILLAVAEYFWARLSAEKLHIRCTADHILAEPEEPVTWTAEVENRGILPILFVRLREDFPREAKLHAEESWMESHRIDSFQRWHVEEKFSLMPRQRSRRSLKISFDDRGVYEIGRYHLAAGDLLGFSEYGRPGPGEELVVMPRRSENLGAIQALGGFLGDISVRRFILEDPILTVGFRDYTGREPMKAISWTRTAVTGTMQVKQYDYTAEQTVQVLLNVEGASEEALEECFRLTRSVCETLERQKIPYAFRTNGNLPGPVGKIFHLADGLGSTHLSTILYGLGKADGTCFQSLRYLVTKTLSHRRSNEAYILITPEPDEDAQASIRALETASPSGLCLLVAAEGEAEE